MLLKKTFQRRDFTSFCVKRQVRVCSGISGLLFYFIKNYKQTIKQLQNIHNYCQQPTKITLFNGDLPLFNTQLPLTLVPLMLTPVQCFQPINKLL